MNIIVRQGKILSQIADLAVVALYEKKKGKTETWDLPDDPRAKTIADVLEEDGFSGRRDEWVSFRSFGNYRAKRIGVIGLGKREDIELDAFRLLGARMIKSAKGPKVYEIAVAFPAVDAGSLSLDRAIEAFAEGVWMGAYRFHPYQKKESKTGEGVEIKTVTIVIEQRSMVEACTAAVREARVLSEATMLARDLVNTPSMEMTPARLAEVAKTVADTSDRIDIKIFDAQEMETMGMHAALAIGRGSQHAPVGVHLTYHPTSEPKKRIVFVGKAVTFDSGGLSLKPSDSMTTMKIDMAGAANVIGVFQALPLLAPDVEVHGIFLAVENMPSGTACRPGDVVKAKNGTTIEILNTDAEGRVTLADALSYASELKPDALIDMATLTGACVVALGEDVAGLLANDRPLADALLAVSRETGEALWELPLYQPYLPMIKSKIADVKNTGGGRGAGTVTAALFLQQFVAKRIPWAHIDIAGPSYAEKETRSDFSFGGTGFGVRLFLRYLQGVSR